MTHEKSGLTRLFLYNTRIFKKGGKMRWLDQVWAKFATIRADRLVLTLGLVFGSLLCLLIPPFMVADEGAHFFRAYELSEGGLISVKAPKQNATGRMLPASLQVSAITLMDVMPHDRWRYFVMQRLWNAFKQPLEPHKRSFTAFSNTALYTPIPYLPQAAAIWIGRCFELPPVFLMYLGRFANLIASMLLVSLAVRLMPVQKWTMAMCALLPMSLYDFSSLSADALTIALCFLYTAMVLRLALLPEQRATRLYLVQLAAVGLALTLSKSVYSPVLGLLIVVPTNKFPGGLKERLTALSLLAGSGILLTVGWMYLIRDIFVAQIAGVDPAEQLLYLAQHGGQILTILHKTATFSEDYFRTMVGTELGWFDVHLAYSAIRPMALALALFAIFDTTVGPRLTALPRLVAATLWLLTALLIALTLYLDWTPVGKSQIDGIVGRYFLPVLPLLLIPLATRVARKVSWSGQATALSAVLIGSYTGLYTITRVVLRYYEF